jgi:hypothetical protein
MVSVQGCLPPRSAPRFASCRAVKRAASKRAAQVPVSPGEAFNAAVIARRILQLYLDLDSLV